MQPIHRLNAICHSALCMGTVINLKVVTKRSEDEAARAIERAFASFRSVEQVCSRFLEHSEIMQIIRQVGVPVQVSEILFETVRFAITVAKLTDGVFDPTVGRLLENYGFNRHYLTGKSINSEYASDACSYKDVILNEEARTILLRKPLLLDLGAIAKGFAIDLAARELRQFEGFLIDAGGDIFAGGLNERKEAWKIGIRHPFRHDETVCTLQVTDTAVCTSGGYERISSVRTNAHHIIDPVTGASPSDVVSCTVVAPFAMMADACSTAAFLLGQHSGVEFLENHCIDGCIITSSLDIHKTKNMKGYFV